MELTSSKMAGRASRPNRRSERGAALVELAVALPLLAVILVGTIDFGRAFRTAMVVTAAARAGAFYGSMNSVNAGEINGTGMVNAATAVLTANGLTSGSSPTAAENCYCANTSGVFDVAAVACNSTCASGKHVVTTVTVTVSRTFSMISPFPGLPSSVVITRGVTARAR